MDRRVDSHPSGAAPHRSERPQCGAWRLPSARPPSGTRRPPPHPTPPLTHRRPGCAAPHGARAELGAGLDTFLPVLGMKQELAVLASAAFAVISVVVNLWGNVLTEKKRAELQLEVSPPEGQTGRQAGRRGARAATTCCALARLPKSGRSPGAPLGAASAYGCVMLVMVVGDSVATRRPAQLARPLAAPHPPLRPPPSPPHPPASPLLQLERDRSFQAQLREVQSVIARYRGPLLESAIDLEQRIFHLITDQCTEHRTAAAADVGACEDIM